MTEKQGELLFQELERKIFEIYPFFKFGESHRSTIDGNISSQQYEFLIGQNAIRNSDYSVPKPGKFIHYTTLDSFCGIINSGELRLFNLHNLNDPYEFNHLIKEHELRIDPKMIEYFKKRLFVSSFCRYNDNEGDDFNLWRLYGDNGLGVGIVFEVINSREDWNSCLLGNVIYDSENELSQKIIKAISLTNEYIGKGIDRIPKLLAQLLLYHKKKIWSIERESRLSVFYDHNGYNQERDYNNPIFRDTLRTAIKSNGIVSSCISFPLEVKINQPKNPSIANDDFEKMKEFLPRLRIEKIIFGYRFNEKLFESAKEYSMHIYSAKWNAYIKYEKSRLLD
ncbi:MAG: DUF2971 domain-containing protein [Bacteroidota bacterium]